MQRKSWENAHDLFITWFKSIFITFQQETFDKLLLILIATAISSYANGKYFEKLVYEEFIQCIIDAPQKTFNR